MNVSTQTRNELTHPIMHQLILNWFGFFRKRKWNESTHSTMHRLILSWFGFCRNRKWHVSMHAAMCPYIKSILLSLYTIFLLCFLVIEHGMSRYKALCIDAYCYPWTIQRDKRCMSWHKTRMCRHKQEMSRHIPLCIDSYWVNFFFSETSSGMYMKICVNT